MPFSSINIIVSPYHVGLRNHRVGNGPYRILSTGLQQDLQALNIPITTTEIQPVDDFEGEIGRSFELLRRTSNAVSTAVSNNQFPLILSGNCMASAAVACGLQQQEKKKKDKELSFIYFDAHDDLDSPDVNENGYLDAMGLSMLRGESWKTLMRSVPGFDPTHPFRYDNGRFLYCGLRDQSGVQRQRVIDAGMHAIWGSTERKVDFVGELRDRLAGKQGPFNGSGSSLVHLDLDVLDESYGKVNSYPSPGGMFEDELVQCLGLVPGLSAPVSLTVCSFDPEAGDGERIAGIGKRAVRAFFEGLVSKGGFGKVQV